MHFESIYARYSSGSDFLSRACSLLAQGRGEPGHAQFIGFAGNTGKFIIRFSVPAFELSGAEIKKLVLLWFMMYT